MQHRITFDNIILKGVIKILNKPKLYFCSDNKLTTIAIKDPDLDNLKITVKVKDEMIANHTARELADLIRIEIYKAVNRYREENNNETQ